jgi:hypothetical protein
MVYEHNVIGCHNGYEQCMGLAATGFMNITRSINNAIMDSAPGLFFLQGDLGFPQQ